MYQNLLSVVGGQCCRHFNEKRLGKDVKIGKESFKTVLSRWKRMLEKVID